MKINDYSEDNLTEEEIAQMNLLSFEDNLYTTLADNEGELKNFVSSLDPDNFIYLKSIEEVLPSKINYERKGVYLLKLSYLLNEIKKASTSLDEYYKSLGKLDYEQRADYIREAHALEMLESETKGKLAETEISYKEEYHNKR